MATFRVTGGVLTGETVASDAHPEHPIAPGGEPPLGIWGPTDPRPTPPIVIPPDSIGPGVPTHPIYLPVFPTHPIVIPPDAVEPGVPTHPIYIPVYPMHPIVIPPEAIGPGVPTHPIVLPPYEPGHPIVLPPGSIDGAHPEHPIVIPPPEASGSGKWVYSKAYGWVWDPGPGGKPQPPTIPGDTTAAGGNPPGRR